MTTVPWSNASRSHPDRLRQMLNVVLAISQVAAIAISVAGGPGQELNNGNPNDPPVVPALYTFSIWFPIYSLSLAYAVYQVLPVQRESALLRATGFWTISAFSATTMWAVVQAAGWDWLTVVCIFWMLASLVGALVAVRQHARPLSRSERWFIRLPLELFAGYVTVATVANTAAVMTASGVQGLVFGEQAWAVLMLLVAGAISAALTRFLCGGGWYALAVVWAAVGIIVQNTLVEPLLPVALAAGGAAVLVLGALVAKLRRRA